MLLEGSIVTELTENVALISITLTKKRQFKKINKISIISFHLKRCEINSEGTYCRASTLPPVGTFKRARKQAVL